MKEKEICHKFRNNLKSKINNNERIPVGGRNVIRNKK